MLDDGSGNGPELKAGNVASSVPDGLAKQIGTAWLPVGEELAKVAACSL